MRMLKMAETKMLSLIGLILIVILQETQGTIPPVTGPHPCERVCGGPPMECHFDLVAEWFMSLSKACYNCPFNLDDCKRPHCIPGNGNRRLVAVFNRQMPGPTLTVCKGDTIIANVSNEMENGVTLSIHWHGIHQRHTQYMDGVPYVTQCPIIFRNYFVYKFVAEQVGTYFYHSHEALMLGDGLFGTLVVKKPPSENAHYHLYDHDCDSPDGDCEQLVFLQDWAGNNDWVDYMRDKFYTNKRGWAGADERVMMINGQNRMYEIFTVDSDGATALTPHHVYHVKKGKRYRFRAVASTTNACRYLVDISDHRLKVVATDGPDIKPVDVDQVCLFGGERFDFIVDMNQPVGNYWLRLNNIGPCHHSAQAVIHYEGAPDPYDLTFDESQFTPVDKPLSLNPPLSSDTDKSPTHNNWPYTEGVLTIADLEALDPLPEEWKGPADKVFYIAFDVEDHGEHYNHPVFYPGKDMPDDLHPGQAVFNNISMQLPVSPPLSQPENDKHNVYCNDETHTNCDKDLCHCTHVIEVALGDVVDLVNINEARHSGWTGHPNHIHGYHGRVMAYHKLGDMMTKEQGKQLYESRQMNLNMENPILKDTYQIAGGGYTVIRFLADNPGYWIMHCHILFHAMEGMDLVIKVGEHKDFPPVPKGFPKCGPFTHDEETAKYLGENNDGNGGGNCPAPNNGNGGNNGHGNNGNGGNDEKCECNGSRKNIAMGLVYTLCALIAVILSGLY